MKKKDIINAAADFGARFQVWLDFILRWECEYDEHGHIRTENVPGDRGGLTFAGIDSRSHPAFSFSDPKPEDVARIYYKDYWQPARVGELPFPVGEVVANYAVNMGLSAAVKLLQTALNSFDAHGDIRVDGVLGPKTVRAVENVPEEELADRIEDEAGDRYRRLVARKSSQGKFLKGWLNRNRSLERWWQGLAA